MPDTARRPVPLSLGALLAAGALLVGCTAATTTTTPPSSTAPGSAAPMTSAPAPSTTAAAPAGPVAPEGTPTAQAMGLDAPWSVVSGAGTVLLSERDTGNIVELLPDGTTRVVGTVPGVLHGGEGGLLGLAFDAEDRLYAYSTAADGNRIQRFALDGGAGSLALGDAETIIDRLPSASNHNGGRIAFGPDGMLYATVGDAADPQAAQDLASLAGKILRMTPDGAVPADNPFPDSLVYSYGHRNPQGLDWAADGTLFAAEFGQNTWDELNIITPGANYGWPTVEGIGGVEGFVDPVQQWATSEASPSGLAVIDGTIFIANLRGASIRAVPVADPSTSEVFYEGEYGRIRHVAESPSGELWFLTNNTDGRGNPSADDDQLVSVPLIPVD